MKRKILSVLLVIAMLAASLLTVSCGNLEVNRPQPDAPQQQEQTEKQEQQESPGKQDEQKQPGKQEEQPGKQEEQKKPGQNGQQNQNKPEKPVIDENGSYTKKEDVALYLWTYKKLPSNFITKSKAENLGWKGGGLDNYPKTKGKCIGGDKFGNREGLLPKGYKYIECDIDTLGAKERGAKRIVFTEDCSRIYYTGDHYESFELLYGEK